MLEDISRGVPGGDDRVGMRDDGGEKESQEGGVGVGRPIELRARALAKSRPVHGERRIAARQALLQRSISRRLEIELSAGSSSTFGPVPLASAPRRMVCPRQFQSSVRVSMAFTTAHPRNGRAPPQASCQCAVVFLRR